MKRITAIVLISTLLLSLWGCSLSGIMEPVTFYYPRQMDTDEAFASVVENGVLGAESREASGHTEDLRYLLSLHLRGPLDDDLRSPFPAETALLNVHWEDTTLIVTLNSAFATLKDMDLTVACACLAQTCFSLSDAEFVQILAYTSAEEDVDIIFSRESLLMSDDHFLAEEPAETTQ